MLRTAQTRVRVKGTGLYLADMQASMSAPGAETPAYHAASTGRRMSGFRPTGAGPNAIVAANAPEMVRRSRDLGRNNPHGKKGLGLYQKHIVGTGIKPRSLCSDPGVREALHQLWADWTDYSDADGAYDFYGQQAEAVGEMVEGGEAFARLRPRRPSDGLPVPLQIQVIPTEQVPLHYGIPNGGNSVMQGIERDPVGRRVAYWMYRQHPGDGNMTTAADSWQISRVDAADVCHLRLAPAGQLRGLPWLATAITTLHQLGQWRDASLLRKQMVTMLVGFVRRSITGTTMTEEELARAWGEVQAELGDLPAVALEPGTMQYLEPGEEVQFSDWKETAGQDEVFERSSLRTVSAGLDVIYEELSGDWKDTTDRTFRAAFNTFKRGIRMYQHHLVAFQFCRPIWLRWVDVAVASGALKVPSRITDADLKRVEWIPERWEYLNPKQDIEAATAEIDGGLTSREAAVAERGDDVEEVDKKRASDRERERRLGLQQKKRGGAPDKPEQQDDTE